ncbi:MULTISPECIES: UDP-glucose dehydrogenase family protein [Legionella]|uniref:UDP-glucose 6-dehydrogenase n=1 Tax=Legionella septentrionalis TaxID=2498109 RepID=A0A3S1CKR1_9GAMM|nr:MULTISPECIES: UDP-glucose/GDP-mannose dehydrogenase family protein [Legionella]MCP0913541.1 UDP-glucose/GDP-mannose dehydrogenase family protein [Legionella sp. 27cVA30]RUQ82117.1 UDP-glucose/GDP-mannose dehydrogenase family protein [Legionella septentrionalis]RUQ99770.1 UDP-glucose/GDP-mannose dehydrogenase family protein [Legionella septentrionalis]RUR11036.1 UDP-glucose/GDP-mannose dehydrogenase family protein [Legionella septentrionalis]RUR15198.1 UDP-glucose/GDP-mannose dehydrogenase f
MMIAVYGAGYVGLVSAVCFAKLGHQVICADINSDRIKQLNAGECPIYEEQLPELLKEQLSSRRLHFTSEPALAISKANVHIIATGTPSLPDGSADLSQVFAVAVQVARETEADALLVTKSTVPVGTGTAIEKLVQEELARRGKLHRIDVASNPEFLREGSAVYDFLNADRIVVGGNEAALKKLQKLYQPLTSQGIPLVQMSRVSAELTKYTANTMLACRISFMNQISNIAAAVGADIDEIREGISLDHRIGPHFLQAGIGYGGSCFPKDTRALIQTARQLGMNRSLLAAIEEINQLQKGWVVQQLKAHFHDELQNLTIGIWGLAFKPGTDDLREASSLVIIESLLAAGAKLRLYDPAAMRSLQKQAEYSPSVAWCNSAEHVLEGGVDALVIATEWPVFREFPLSVLARLLKTAPLFDGRNCFEPIKVQMAGISSYYSVGRPHLLGKDINNAS